MIDSAAVTRNRRTGIIAGITGVALLLGGVSFALWDANQDAVEGDEINSGALDLISKKGQWYDISGDRTDEGGTQSDPVTTLDGTNAHKILLDDLFDDDSNLIQGGFHIVPGDTIQKDQQMILALQGDNLVARLDIDPNGTASHTDAKDGAGNKIPVDPGDPSKGNVQVDDFTGLTFKYRVITLTQDLNGKTVAGEVVKDWTTFALAADTTTLGYFEADTNEGGTYDFTTATGDTNYQVPATNSADDPDIAIQVKVDFDSSLTGEQQAQKTQALSRLDINLTQVRSEATSHGNFVNTPAQP